MATGTISPVLKAEAASPIPGTSITGCSFVYDILT
jgi:hypothetical protein